MTYRSKRAREILAATAKPHDPLSSKSSTTITACTFASEAASQPTKKQAMQSPLPPLPEVVLNEKWGPFFPPNTTTKCAQPPPNNLGPIWKKPPTRSTSSSVKEAAKDLPGYQKKNQPKLASMVSPNMPPNIPYSISPNSLSSHSTSSPTTHRPFEHSQPLERGSQNLDTGAVKTSVAASHNWQKIGQKIAQESKEIPKKSKSLRAKSLPDWPQNIDFDDKEEVLTIDSKGNTTLVSGTVLPIDVWSNNGVKYFVEFNDLCQPIRKGGHILIRFIGMMEKMETHCPVEEEDWHAIDSHIKGKILTDIRDRFVIPDGAEYDKQALKLANKAWRKYRFSLRKEYYKPNEKTLDEMCSQVPPSGISSNNWIKLVKYWHSDKGKTLSECGKKARAFLNQYHRLGSNSFANQQADYEDEHGEKMSLLALWIKSHMGKDGSFLSGTDTADFVDDVKAKVEQLRLKYPTKSELELENEAFEETMKEGYGKVQRRNIVMDSVKQEMTALHKRNDVLEKDNAKMKDQVQETYYLLNTLVGQFSQVIDAVRQGKSSPELLNCTQELLGLTQQQCMVDW
ncbi:ATP synthase subunit b [Bienertia sinuspersici]